MRIPLSNVCRAFPELDKFSDAQCRAYVRAVKQSRRRQSRLIALVSVVVVFAAIIPIGGIFGLLLSALPLDSSSEAAFSLVFATFMLFSFGLPAVFGLWIRDHWLRRAIAKHLKSSRCPSCQYQLLGLPIADGCVRCPECGDTLRLVDLGLTPEQLMSQSPGVG